MTVQLGGGCGSAHRNNVNTVMLCSSFTRNDVTAELSALRLQRQKTINRSFPAGSLTSGVISVETSASELVNPDWKALLLS